MNKLFRTLMIALVVIGSACTTQAQDEGDQKLHVKISKEVDGETKTFEGEYANTEEMMSDPAYQEFAGDMEDMNIWMDADTPLNHILEFDQGPGNQSFSFSFDDDDFFPRNFRKHFRFKNGPQAFFFGDGDDGVIDLRGFDSEAYEKELSEKMEELQEKLKGLNKDLKEDIMESLKGIEEMHSDMGIHRRIHTDGISIEDVGDDFGKRGKVSENEKLELDGMNFMVMRNRLNLRFRVEKEGELSVNISNEAGKNIYSRYFESFRGTFSDTIDFSKYADGKYLMEIQQGKKRLTKKIVID